ncbi:MAG: hypothetical protein LBH30_07745 [Prevotellaceae bacterium]|jgi:hypothetical protein|nr:hypothetical protein [Prevotellaceae bacterium]
MIYTVAVRQLRGGTPKQSSEKGKANAKSELLRCGRNTVQKPHYMLQH